MKKKDYTPEEAQKVLDDVSRRFDEKGVESETITIEGPPEIISQEIIEELPKEIPEDEIIKARKDAHQLELRR